MQSNPVNLRRANCVVLLLLLLAANKPDLLSQAKKGEKLNDAQAKKLETNLQNSPDDADTRAMLLGYDLGRKTNVRQSRAAGILWMINQRTDDPISGSVYCQIDPTEDADGYAKAKSAWDAQVSTHATDPALLANAAAFFSITDFNAAEALLQQSIVLQPKNADWPERLAHLYESRFAQHPDDTARLAPAALDLRQSAYNLTTDPAHRFEVLVQMPVDAFRADDLISATRLSKQVLGAADRFKTNPFYGDAIHRGNIVMGELAIHAGKIEEAEEDLTAAGQTPGSPTLATIGPDFNLAKELLAKGERIAVSNYLIQCKKFWTAGSQRLKFWTATLDAGGTPDL